MKMNPEKLLAAFTFWRRVGKTASGALERARVDVMEGRDRYPSSVAHGAALGSPMESGAQWGNPDALGLRFVGWQDEQQETRRHTHKGWFTRADEYDEVFRGCVYQLPARDGCARYVPAYREGTDTKKGWQDTCGEVSAALDFSNVIRGARGETGSRYDIADSLRDACRAADSLAENAARRSREYDEAWQAGNRYAALRDELETTRKECRSLVRELKSARSHTPAICKALRASVREMRQDMKDAHEKAEELRDNVAREYRDAFAEGANLAAFPG
jgi:hypothetical protein